MLNRYLFALPATLLLLAAPLLVSAQIGGVGIGTTTPNASAALEISSTSKGLLLPRLSLAQRNALTASTTAPPVPGLVIYQTDNTPGLYAYDGTAWLRLGPDNLGNHTATQNLNLAGNQLVGGTATAPGTTGLTISPDGLVRLGSTNTSGRPNAGFGYGLRLDNADAGLLATGEVGYGQIPASGAGLRLMWHPYKAALRAGAVDGNQWDDANVRFYSQAFGYDATASAYGAFASGDATVASGTVSVAMGASSQATGYASLAVGYHATASSDYGVAIGNRANTNGYAGSVVINANAFSTDELRAVANNEFRVRAPGGIALRTNTAGTTGCNLPAGSGSFTCTSARGTKNHFRTVNESLILNQIATLPVLGWQYQTEPGNIRHLGPFAGDFHRAFGLGTDSLSIGLQDIDGVLFVGLKELARQHAALQKQTHTLRADYEALRTRLVQLEQQVQNLAAPVSTSRPQRRRGRQPRPTVPAGSPTLAVAAAK